MRHGESQEKGQEESQEEIVLALVNSASEKLSRSPLQILETVPATKRALSFQQPDLSNAS
jgi:hypothetical protein